MNMELNGKLRKDGDLMESNFQMLRKFKYEPEHTGWCNKDEVKMIENHFKIQERSNVELQNLRDFVVMFYSRQIDRDDENYMKLSDTMSAITGVIDHHKFHRGMEV